MLQVLHKSKSAFTHAKRFLFYAAFIVAGSDLPRANPTSWARAEEPQAALAEKKKTKIPTPDEQKSIEEFYELYRLDSKTQVVKYIKPPFVAGRIIDRKYRWKDRFGNADHGKDGMYVYCYVFHERDGKLEPPGNFAAASYFPDPKDDGGDLVDLIPMLISVSRYSMDDPEKLLRKRITGDFVVRAGTPDEELLVALGPLIKREFGISVKLVQHEVEAPIVVVRGKIKPPFVIKPDTPLELYAATLQPGKGDVQQGTYQEFLTDVGRFIEPTRLVYSEVENPPNGKISWHRNCCTAVDEKARLEDRDVRLVLDHLEDQTGLTFARESRKYQKIRVERDNSQ